MSSSKRSSSSAQATPSCFKIWCQARGENLDGRIQTATKELAAKFGECVVDSSRMGIASRQVGFNLTIPASRAHKVIALIASADEAGNILPDSDVGAVIVQMCEFYDAKMTQESGFCTVGMNEMAQIRARLQALEVDLTGKNEEVAQLKDHNKMLREKLVDLSKKLGAPAAPSGSSASSGQAGANSAASPK